MDLIPEKLTKYKTEAGLSCQDIASAAGCTKSFVAQLARGYKTGCTPELARRIAEVLDVRVSDLAVPDDPADSGSSARRLQKVAA